MTETTAKAPDPTVPRWRFALDTLASISMIGCAGVLLWWVMFQPTQGAERTDPHKVRIPTRPLSIAGAESLGSESAKAVLIEYSDFVCPFCGHFARETFPELRQKYLDTGRVRLVFRQLPLPIHAMAQKAAESALCAGEQGKFWEAHELLFANQQGIDLQSLGQVGSSLSLDSARYKACFDGRMSKRVIDDAAGAKELGVNGTPVFFLGRLNDQGAVAVDEVIPGALRITEFSKAIERTLAKLPAGTQ